MEGSTELGELLVLVRRLVERMDKQHPSELPTVMTYKRAARELDIRMSKLKAMVAAGSLSTVMVHKRRHIPRSEIERIATMTQQARVSGKKRTVPRRPPSSKVDAVMASLDAKLKKMRR